MRQGARQARERGQSLAETALVLLLLVGMTMAIIDFGRMLMLANMITSATRDAARVASAVPRVDRAANGDLCDATTVQDIVVNQLANVGIILDPGAVAIVRGGATPPTMTVTTSVAIPWIGIFAFVPGMTDTLQVSRSVTFRDEHTTGDGTNC